MKENLKHKQTKKSRKRESQKKKRKKSQSVLGLAGDYVVAEGLELRDGGVASGVGDDTAFGILARGLPLRTTPYLHGVVDLR
ncbi:hypothetical protein L484_018802 [Morus notabilis]|uniref:Uncharacterized protein n=1 Tax=Morus notabilis TaxID=981085 RepID=W9R6S5_9ROSA|nr:hypothetical protein L484_018802 [Morus notabilis]